MRYIDADKLQEAFKELHGGKRSLLIDTEPTADVRENVKGEWLPQDHNKKNGMMSTAVYYYPKCSVCGHCANYTNFCPNCGADMREGGKDDIRRIESRSNKTRLQLNQET